MIINNHILELNNIFYFNNQFYINDVENKDDKIYDNFIDNYSVSPIYNKINENNNVETIDNILVVQTLHSCFSHALIDRIFPYFWAVNDIREINKDFKNFSLFITQKKILQYPNNKNFINESKCEYIGVWKELSNIITKNILFEHLIQKQSIFYIKKCYFYIKNDMWQRSPWNCSYYYPNRNVNIKNILYNDNIIYDQLKKFVRYTKKLHNIKSPLNNKYKTIIIERKYNRFWDKKILEKIIENIKKNNLVEYNGIKILDDLTLNQQIKIFSENNVFIFRHGSCLANLLWIPNNSIIFDINVTQGRKEIVKRIAKVTDSKVYSMLYKNIDYNKFRFLNTESNDGKLTD